MIFAFNPKALEELRGLVVTGGDPQPTMPCGFGKP